MSLGASLDFLKGQLTGIAPPGLPKLSVDVLPRIGRASKGPQCILWCRKPQTRRIGMGGVPGAWLGEYPVEIFLRLGLVPGQKQRDYLFSGLLATVDKTLRELPNAVPWPPLVQDPETGDQSYLWQVGNVIKGQVENVRMARRMFELRAVITCDLSDYWEGY